MFKVRTHKRRPRLGQRVDGERCTALRAVDGRRKGASGDLLHGAWTRRDSRGRARAVLARQGEQRMLSPELTARWASFIHRALALHACLLGGGGEVRFTQLHTQAHTRRRNQLHIARHAP